MQLAQTVTEGEAAAIRNTIILYLATQCSDALSPRAKFKNMQALQTVFAPARTQQRLSQSSMHCVACPTLILACRCHMNYKVCSTHHANSMCSLPVTAYLRKLQAAYLNPATTICTSKVILTVHSSRPTCTMLIPCKSCMPASLESTTCIDNNAVLHAATSLDTLLC